MTEELELQMQETIDLTALILDDLRPESWESIEHARGLVDASVLRMLSWRYAARPVTGRISELRSVVLTIAREIHAAANLDAAKAAATYHRSGLSQHTLRPDVTITLRPDGSITTEACGGSFSGKLREYSGEEPHEHDVEMAAVISLLPLIAKFVSNPVQLSGADCDAVRQLSNLLAECSEPSHG